MSVARAALSADGRDPFSSPKLRTLFQSHQGSQSPPRLAMSGMIESVLLAESETLLDSFESTHHTRFPFLDMGCLRRLTRQCKAEGHLGCIHGASAAERFNLMCVLAIGLAMEGEHISFAGQIEGNLFIVALGHLNQVFRFSAAIDQVRALLLLTLYSMIRSSVGGTWHLIGFAMRVSIGHELHITKATSKQTDLPRKVFWSAYMLEQMTCRALDRASCLGSHDIPDQVRPTNTDRS